jgi:hypothetical protein
MGHRYIPAFWSEEFIEFVSRLSRSIINCIKIAENCFSRILVPYFRFTTQRNLKAHLLGKLPALEMKTD